jgi:hypothetical protein
MHPRAHLISEPPQDLPASMLPTLKNIFLEGFQSSTTIPEGIREFVAERQLNDNPIVISCWDRDSEQETF